MLAAQLTDKYRHKNCVVMALGDGGAIVGAQIATQLHCVLTLLMSAEIKLPREPQPIAGITADGSVAYNHNYSDGEIDELASEYHGLIESEKLTQMYNMNHLVGTDGAIKRELLSGHNVIIVSDGLKTGFEIDLAKQFLKPIDTEKLIVATPLASVQAVDRMHVLADDLCCLSVIAEYMDTDHYYDINDVPDHAAVLKIIKQI